MRGSSWTFYNINIGVGLLNPSPQDEDLPKLKDVDQMGFLNNGVIYQIYYYVNVVTIKLSPQYIAFNECHTRQGSNDTDSEGHEPISSIVKSHKLPMGVK